MAAEIVSWVIMAWSVYVMSYGCVLKTKRSKRADS